MGLSNKQKVFIEGYLECWNGTKAARQAGYAHPSVQASRLLRNIKVQEAIDERLTEKCMSADEVLMRLADMGRGDIRDFVLVREDGSWTIDWESARGQTHLIKSVRDTKHGLVFEIYDAQAALEKIGRAHGLFKERHELSGPDGGPIETTGGTAELLAAIERELEATAIGKPVEDTEEPFSGGRERE